MTDDFLGGVLRTALRERYPLPTDVDLLSRMPPLPIGPDRRRRRTLLAAAASVLVVAALGVTFGLLAGGGHRSVSPASTGTPTSLPAGLARLWAQAQQDVYVYSGGAAILEAQAVRSTHRHALAVTMAEPNGGNEPVWVIQVETKNVFVCSAYCSGGADSVIRARYVVLIGPATSTGRDGDMSISLQKADLSRLGSVITLYP